MRNKLIEENNEITIIGLVKEVGTCWRTHQAGIATENEFYAVKLNEEGKNLLYEVGNKVEATGTISRAKDGLCRIAVTCYRVFEMDEDDLEEYGDHSDFYVGNGN